MNEDGRRSLQIVSDMGPSRFSDDENDALEDVMELAWRYLELSDD